ncbi:hypothetical protein P170DRAFT_455878 [Aspergillus steynii IBT 23096]|uniref:Rhodopsin domain-containing protein n=1 Tax=Aspergillus steynii IBT 23096 TaxID=1392250 RepID=A0A2I2G8E4_9EURO|nr:uncharacterized protein P170DRAFT_455878 [Aspergillus steynii IBT 23096]PLB49145.1 hypothetical protein P170DRAFT_455878 [Aspergillus steynii IBT 23096]
MGWAGARNLFLCLSLAKCDFIFDDSIFLLYTGQEDMAATDDFTIEAFTLLALAIVTIAVRIVARCLTVGVKNFQLDDYLMPVAGIVYGFETAAAYCVGAWWKGLANNAMTDQQRLALDPASEEFSLRVGGSKTQVVGWSLYTTLLWLLKACMAIFFSRVAAGLVNMTIRIRLAYLFVAATYIAVICSILFGCHPMSKNWQIYPDPGNYCQPAVSHIDVYVTVTLNVATDVYLISIPTPMLFKARLPWREKLELLVLFSGGIFVMAAGILRCVLIVTAGANGAQQAGSWACRETFVAVIIGNAPMIYPLFRRMARRAGWYISTTYGHGGNTSQSYPLSEGDGKQASHDAESTAQSRKKKFRHPLSIPDTQWGEWERLSGDGDEKEGITVVRETIVRSKDRRDSSIL